ncbi:hypothetical protein PsorP6_013799 [Peronosclerospora sorghi]|uniref:Uncharacterized protein n=1 Tax=Peronosclerospora sorghi TaxID=230839 RepID=A0ACC0VI74_9STRA|nr:hypothetical protein PsorP6_013799 [Peronosclerospora sorghi]
MERVTKGTLSQKSFLLAIRDRKADHPIFTTLINNIRYCKGTKPKVPMCTSGQTVQLAATVGGSFATAVSIVSRKGLPSEHPA